MPITAYIYDKAKFKHHLCLTSAFLPFGRADLTASATAGLSGISSIYDLMIHEREAE